ncbi:EamA family transporter RarD [Alkalicoccus daliensis]|uniref:Chloramphenicol-sensitive protein RarD n=1 Tax=Alkalicoccus daliensis TaxID=745820 RepID=A0A1G9ZIE8_9BACI|nr:EamA family transporter RarD [Alkalicoccus daliensis]SDN20847.1 chloramphenicol-sensitive protein RarD [Alkalicoccus daliensis]
MLQEERSQGIAAGIGAYSLWGLLPIYWKWIDHVPSPEVLAHRIIWSLIFLIGLFLFMRRAHILKEDLRYIAAHPKIIVGIMTTAFFISVNWVLFIWAVANERIVEVSLGYYINPLLNVVLGVLFFKETLSLRQRLAVGLAFIGVLILTISFGAVPYIALTLAFSFGMYGLVKKQTQIGAMTGLIIETLFLLPIALIYLFIIHDSFEGLMHAGDSLTPLLLIFTGAATAVPLLLFGTAAKKIPLSLLGFLQYIAPTTMLILGVLLYKEPFTIVHLVSFLFIWSALLMYSIRPKKQNAS